MAGLDGLGGSHRKSTPGGFWYKLRFARSALQNLLCDLCNLCALCVDPFLPSEGRDDRHMFIGPGDRRRAAG
jgi:hypothetical protein